MSQVDYCSNYCSSLVTGILISTSAHFNLLSTRRVIFLKHKSDHVTPTQNCPTGFPAHLEKLLLNSFGSSHRFSNLPRMCWPLRFLHLLFAMAQRFFQMVLSLQLHLGHSVTSSEAFPGHPIKYISTSPCFINLILLLVYLLHLHYLTFYYLSPTLELSSV